MKMTEQIIQGVHQAFETVVYFAVMAVKENFYNYISHAGTVGAPARTIAILGNGPALRDELPALVDERHERDFCAVNFFAEDERFTILKPKYYVLSDPMFFRYSAHRKRVEDFYRTLNERVAWPMNLYVQYYNPEKFDYRAVLPNPHIRIVRFHTQLFKGFPELEFKLFRHGLGSANYGTVVQVAIYVALLLHYKRIELFGVDHTLLEGLTVDETNRLCRADRHYYDDPSAPVTLKPMMQKVPPMPYRMSVYLNEVAEIFRGHERLAAYARTCGARIINRTRGSMIDAYPREVFPINPSASLPGGA